MEGIDRVSDPDFVYHRKQRQKRERRRQEEEAQRGQQRDFGDTNSDMRYSQPQDRSVGNWDDGLDGNGYSDGKDTNYGRDYDQPRGRNGYESYEDERSGRSNGVVAARRPGMRSRSSHQGDRSAYNNGYNDDDRPRQREHKDNRRTRRQKSPSPNGMKKIGNIFSDSKGGLGAAAVGSVAGGFLAYRAAKSKGKSGEGTSDPFLVSLLGAVAGGVGANVVEKYIEHGKEEGSVRDKWGEEVGTTRKQLKGKVKEMTKGGVRSRSLDQEDKGRRRRSGGRYDDDYDDTNYDDGYDDRRYGKRDERY